MSIATDFKVCADGKSFPRSIGTFLLNPCFHSVALFRFSAALYRIRLEPLAKVVWYINRVIYSVDLDYRARLAPGFKLTHGLCVVVGAGVGGRASWRAVGGGPRHSHPRGGGRSHNPILARVWLCTQMLAFLGQFILEMMR